MSQHDWRKAMVVHGGAGFHVDADVGERFPESVRAALQGLPAWDLRAGEVVDPWVRRGNADTPSLDESGVGVASRSDERKAYQDDIKKYQEASRGKGIVILGVTVVAPEVMLAVTATEVNINIAEAVTGKKWVFGRDLTAAEIDSRARAAMGGVLESAGLALGLIGLRGGASALEELVATSTATEARALQELATAGEVGATAGAARHAPRRRRSRGRRCASMPMTWHQVVGGRVQLPLRSRCLHYPLTREWQLFPADNAARAAANDAGSAAAGGEPAASAWGARKPPKRIYSARELIRRVDEPGPFHNFPESFDAEIFERGATNTIKGFFKKAKPGYSNDSIQYTLTGSVNGRTGTFEIAVRPSASGNTELVMHRFFRPDKTK
jgi:hypothetical protein